MLRNEALVLSIDRRHSLRRARLERRIRCARSNDRARDFDFSLLRFGFEVRDVPDELLPLVDVEQNSHELATPPNPQAMIGLEPARDLVLRAEVRQRDFRFERELIEASHTITIR